MRAIGTLLILCVALAVVKMAVVGLLMIGISILVWAACQHPRETFGLLAYVALMGLVSAQPWVWVAIVGLVAVTAQFAEKAD
ncbi:hypothetical protein HDC29_003406 [Sphingopyxis sp. JAI108]|nr:hypothetical protein [Sphingopyxis sp. JAI108]